MQIFVKDESGRSITLDDVQPEHTIADIKQMIIEKQKWVGAAITDLYLHYDKAQMAALDDSQTLASYKISAESTLKVRRKMPPFSTSYDQQVQPVLQQNLIALEQSQEPLFVFIGIGSCYYYKKEEQGEAITNSIHRQQCPAGLLSYCEQKKLSLVIFLLDEGFRTATDPQIYTLDQNWQLDHEEMSGKVRYYRYHGTSHRLQTYATNIERKEYDRELLTIAGIELAALKSAVCERGGQFVAGNFFQVQTPPHASSLKAEELETLGFRKQ